jgi:hypothetical protein
MIRSARWVGGAAILAAMLLGLGAAADAKDCTRATPLPTDTTITSPAADVPADLAKFSAAWGGVWTTGPGDDGPCTTLVVEDVFPNGFVRVVYSVGTQQPLVPQPRYWRAAGRIVDGALRFVLPVPTRPEITYRFAGAELAGTFKDGPVIATVTAARIADPGRTGGRTSRSPTR